MTWLDPHLTVEPVLSNSWAWRSEVKQTQTWEFGTEKCLLQNQERRTGFWLVLKTPKLSNGFWKRIFTGKCKDFRVCEFFSLVAGEVTGWCSRALMLSLKLLFPWVGVLVPAKELKDTVLCIFLDEKSGPSLGIHCCFLTGSSFVFAFFPFPS